MMHQGYEIVEHHFYGRLRKWGKTTTQELTNTRAGSAPSLFEKQDITMKLKANYG